MMFRWFAIFALLVFGDCANNLSPDEKLKHELNSLISRLNSSESVAVLNIDLYALIRDLVRLETQQQFANASTPNTGRVHQIERTQNNDSTTILKRIGCKTYHVSTAKLNFSAALNFCREAGMKLATPNTRTKYQCLKEALKNSDLTVRHWIAASNEDSAQYFWKTTNEVANLTGYWRRGQPNGHPEHCVVINTVSDYSLDDYQCFREHPCICES